MAAIATTALAAASLAATSATLSDHTAAMSGGTLSATSSDWLAESFLDGDAGTALQAVLAVATASGASTLSLDPSDASALVPDALLATFWAVSSSATTVSFVLTGDAVAASTVDWVVLSDPAGRADWAWSTDGGGTGTGFTGVRASSDDGGDTSFAGSTLYPLQMAISAVSAVAEPASSSLVLAGRLAVAVALRHRTDRADERAAA